MKTIHFLLIALALYSYSLSADEQPIQLSKHISTVEAPVPIKRIPPEYPMKAAREGRSGWARYSFIIEKDGSVSNVVEIDSSGSKDFSDKGIKALKRWKYQPALENGKPIQQCVNSVQLDYKMGKNRSDGVRRKFKRKYKLAVQAFDERNFSLGNELLEELASIEFRYMTENNLLHTLSAEFARAQNNPRKQFQHLRKVRYSGDDKTSKKYRLSILKSQFSLAIELNKFKYANRVYNQLKQLHLTPPELKKYETVIAKVDALILGKENIVVEGNIQQSNFWHYSLIRNEFSLAEIKGTLNKLDIRCANKRHVYTIEKNNTWSLPKEWNNCSIFVYGDNDTRFKLVEHPIKT